MMPASGGAARDLTPGVDYDVPPFNLGEPDSIAFSPDSSEICFTANTDKDAALSTNGDLFTVPVGGGSTPKRITTNPGERLGTALFRGREMDRLPRTGARRLGERSVAVDAV